MFWNDATHQLLERAVGDFSEHLDTDNRRTKSCPDAINELIGQKYFFKINRAYSDLESGGQIYAISMVSKNREKIDEIKNAAVEESISEDTLDTKNDAIETPNSTSPHREIKKETITPNGDDSTKESSNKNSCNQRAQWARNHKVKMTKHTEQEYDLLLPLQM